MLQSLNRGSFSFVALLVINPILILFYQNCSLTPFSQKTQVYQTQVATPMRDQYLATSQAQSESEDRAPASAEPSQQLGQKPLRMRSADCLPGGAGCQNHLSE